MECNHSIDCACGPECKNGREQGVMPDCVRCNHSHYDHIGWRRVDDNSTVCRVIGCGCEYVPKAVF